jgi:hypothetical protein
MRHIQVRGALAVLLVLAVLAVASPSGATNTPTAKQRSQIKYLQTYGHESDGKAPTFKQAFAVVEKYPSVPTMADAQSRTSGAIAPSPVAISSTAASVAPQKMSTRTVTRYWQNGLPDAKEFGYQQTVTWDFNAALNHVCCHAKLHGFAWVAPWASWVWHYDGEQDNDGYPYWQFWNGAPSGDYDEMVFYFIENFHWGYGPISGGLSLHCWLCLYADGTADSGRF